MKRPTFGDVVGGKLSQRDLTTSFKTLIPRYEGADVDLSTFCDATSIGEPFEEAERRASLRKVRPAIQPYSDRLNFIS